MFIHKERGLCASGTGGEGSTSVAATAGSTCGKASRKSREKEGRRDEGVDFSSGGATRQQSPQSSVCAELESMPKLWVGGAPCALHPVESCLPGYGCEALTGWAGAGRVAALCVGRVSWGRRGSL